MTRARKVFIYPRNASLFILFQSSGYRILNGIEDFVIEICHANDGVGQDWTTKACLCQK